LQGGGLTDLVQRAASLREAQEMEAALEVISAAAAQDPYDPRAAFGLAQISFETWRPAAELFAKARTLVPGNLDIIRNHALALAAEGEGDAAEALLESTLRANPGWLDGHRVLAAQRITSGDAAGFDRSYAEAVAADPGNGALRMMWFQQHATMKDWARAGAILADARVALPDHRGLQLAALFHASESGAARDDAELFAGYEEQGDPGLDLCRVRHHLRSGDVARAEAIALRHVDGAAARMFWPYLSLCWRSIGDDRAAWLDGDPIHAATIDLDFSDRELAALAHVLRGLHRMKAPYPEQSVRGGTQTDRQLFFHPDSLIQGVRAKVSMAIQRYIDRLPDKAVSKPVRPEPFEGLSFADAEKQSSASTRSARTVMGCAHPLLGPNRTTPIRFEGSWSVRLAGAGYHSSHTHVLGWISSAFYVALPGGGDTGHLSLGAPPPELELPLQPYCRVEPKPGRLALFPSTLWHATEPFASGERLTIAFDVKLP
jgi:tetratricopeptide (TPR) repeat protein